MQSFANSWGRVVIVVVVTRGRVVIVVVHRLVGVVVILLSEEVGVEVSVETKRSSQSVTDCQYEKILHLVCNVYSNLAYNKYPALTVQALTRPLSHWRVCPCSSRAGSTTCSNNSSKDSSLTGASLMGNRVNRKIHFKSVCQHIYYRTVVTLHF